MTDKTINQINIAAGSVADTDNMALQTGSNVTKKVSASVISTKIKADIISTSNTFDHVQKYSLTAQGEITSDDDVPTVKWVNDNSVTIPVVITEGGTNSTAVLNNDRAMISSGGSIVESAITTTELNLLNDMVSMSTGTFNNDKLVTQGYVDDAVISTRFSSLSDVVAPYDDIGALTVVNASSDGMIESSTLLTEPLLNTFKLSRGTIDFYVTESCDIDQNLSTVSNVTHAGATLTGVSDGIVKSTSGVLSGGNNVTLTSEVAGILPVANGGTNSNSVLNNDRVIVSVGDSIVESLITTSELNLLNDMASVSTGVADNDKLVTQGYVDDTAGLTTFAALTDITAPYSNIGAITAVNATTNGMLESTTLLTEPSANAFSFTRGTSVFNVTESCDIDQDLSITSSPTHAGMTLTGVASGFVKSSSGLLTGGNGVNLVSDTFGILPISKGGTNSNVAMTNDRVMISSGDSIVESATITTSELGLLNNMVSVSTGLANNDKLVTQGYVDDAASGGGTFAALTDITAPYSNIGALTAVNATTNGMLESTTLLTEPSADQFSLTRGATSLNVTMTCDIDQNLSQASSPIFPSLTTGTIAEYVGNAGITFYMGGHAAYFYDYTNQWFSMSGSGIPDDGTNFYIPYTSSDGWYVGWGMADSDMIYMGKGAAQFALTGDGQLKCVNYSVGNHLVNADANIKHIVVDSAHGSYSTISAAIAGVGFSSKSNPYLISVPSNLYSDTVDFRTTSKDYVTINAKSSVISGTIKMFDMCAVSAHEIASLSGNLVSIDTSVTPNDTQYGFICANLLDGSGTGILSCENNGKLLGIINRINSNSSIVFGTTDTTTINDSQALFINDIYLDISTSSTSIFKSQGAAGFAPHAFVNRLEAGDDVTNKSTVFGLSNANAKAYLATLEVKNFDNLISQSGSLSESHMLSLDTSGDITLSDGKSYLRLSDYVGNVAVSGTNSSLFLDTLYSEGTVVQTGADIHESSLHRNGAITLSNAGTKLYASYGELTGNITTTTGLLNTSYINALYHSGTVSRSVTSELIGFLGKAGDVGIECYTGSGYLKLMARGASSLGGGLEFEGDLAGTHDSWVFERYQHDLRARSDIDADGYDFRVYNAFSGRASRIYNDEVSGSNGTLYANSGYLTRVNPSDETLKENIEYIDVTGMSDLMSKTKIAKYTWKSNGSKGMSAMAQAFQELFPDAVESAMMPVSMDSINKDNPKTIFEEKLGFNDRWMWYHLAGTIDLTNRVKQLEQQILEMKNAN